MVPASPVEQLVARGLLACPVCLARLVGEGPGLACAGCGRRFPVRAGIPRLLDDSLPGIAAKRHEIAGWVELARSEGWYEPEDEVDAALPFVNRDLGWDDRNWGANEHSFSLLLERHVQPGLRVLEVGAAKCWGAQHLIPRGCEYVAADILDDPNVGLGRGEFYERRVGRFARIQADGEHLPFVDGAFDLTYCVATLHHALDLGRMVRELARVTRRSGTVAALNEGTRALARSGTNPEQEPERRLGINEHVHSLPAYLWAFARAGLVVRRVEQAEGYGDLRRRRIAGALLRLPGAGRSASTLFAQCCHGYSGVSLYARRLV
ncbi:MAG: methyltransferase domain-containing protein [Actinobacteria bacterium]|nr:methyltransferase domain-containing protein [Actinomycetota bacterium]